MPILLSGAHRGIIASMIRENVKSNMVHIRKNVWVVLVYLLILKKPLGPYVGETTRSISSNVATVEFPTPKPTPQRFVQHSLIRP